LERAMFNLAAANLPRRGILRHLDMPVFAASLARLSATGLQIREYVPT
jgi:hypothetical protein